MMRIMIVLQLQMPILDVKKMGGGLRNKITDSVSLMPCPKCGKLQTSRHIWWNPSTGIKSETYLFCAKCGHNKRTPMTLICPHCEWKTIGWKENVFKCDKCDVFLVKLEE